MGRWMRQNGEGTPAAVPMLVQLLWFELLELVHEDGLEHHQLLLLLLLRVEGVLHWLGLHEAAG
eukprot:scaffold61621_cov31-Tisochrysis_lutea.AAC.1